ncbi:MAG: glycosyltransferase family 4 protein, partial [Treponemataceae bacterium]|nr:glycosyltransferase family 4 protein [Treponemataceae bacterium]
RPLPRQVQKVYDNCDAILIGSKGFEKSICEKGDYKDKCVYFPNWCESAELPEDVEKYRSVAPFASFTEKEFVVLFAGNIGEAQNLDCVIDAAAAMHETNPLVKFVFLGDGRARERLVQKSAGNGILDKTAFFPGRFPIESMPYFMGMADVLLVSLKDELIFNLTVPSKVQFYMAQGKPILAMLNGDGADLVREAKCGIAVPANDKAAFVDAVRQTASMKKEELSEIGANGKQFYDRHFRKEQRMEQLELLLQEVVNGKGL